MWAFIGGFLIGGLLIGLLGFFIGRSGEEKDSNKEETKKDEVKYLRRGIWENTYSAGSGDKKKDFEVQFELGEIESTSTKSKVVVISLSCSKSEYNDKVYKKKLSEMVDNTWMVSSDIEWIDDTAKVRNDKIDQILNS